MKLFYVGATPEVEAAAWESACGLMREAYGVTVRPLRLPGVEFAFDEARRQYRSVAVLEMLVRKCPRDAWKLLALTGRDLYVPVLTFVFGQAQWSGRVAVVSLARLRQEFYGMAPDSGILLERLAREILHETGHLFGLVHCADRRCAMSLATHVRQIDGKNAAWCAACTARVKQAGSEA